MQELYYRLLSTGGCRKCLCRSSTASSPLLKILGPFLLPFNLFSADHKPLDANCGASHGAAEFEIVSDFRYVEEHLLQISRDRDLLNRIGKLPAGDPHSGGPARIVSCNQVRSLT